MNTTIKDRSRPLLVSRNRPIHIGSPAEERINTFPSIAGPVIDQRLEDLRRETSRETVVASALAGVAFGALTLLSRVPRIRSATLTFGIGVFAGALAVVKKRLRSRTEISAEILALRIIRGDFDAITDEQSRRACAMRVLRQVPMAGH